MVTMRIVIFMNTQRYEIHEKVKGKVHPCTGTEALYRWYGP